MVPTRMLFVAATIVVLAFFCAPAAAQLTSEDCLSCHSDSTLTKDLGNGKSQSMFVDSSKFEPSVHASLSCTDCHSTIADYPHENVVAPDCSSCHDAASSAWAESRHGKALQAGNKQSARCSSCHGDVHQILASTDPKSMTFHSNVPKTCGSCHELKFVMEQSGLSAQAAFSYQQSVHGRSTAAGSQKAAVCSDCHNSHLVLAANDQRSSIFKFNIPETCGSCHADISKTFMSSVHGKSVAGGNGQSPVCTDCHGIHMIKAHVDPTSSVAAQNMARTTCGQCHGNVRLTREYGLSSHKIKSYEESFHGLAGRGGSNEVANCASCHGVHNILPSTDPNSTISKTNLPKTCGTCHPGAGVRFTSGRVHIEEDDDPMAATLLSTSGRDGGGGGGGRSPRGTGDKIMKWVSWIYIPLIFLTLGLMALHNIIIWIDKALKARRDPSRTVRRMNRNQRLQHFILLVSFFILVITGFALAYPESLFATVSGSETTRALVHRIAGVAMILLGLYHVAYMVLTREGRQGLRDFWFRFKDLRDATGVVKYHLRLSKLFPKMGRFTYAEKAEYWALIWGTIVMGVTGLMMWFEVQVTEWLLLPRWWVDVATLIHFYEAILATLAIIIWHLYAVMFDSGVYPMSWAWFDGRMSEAQFRHEHGLAYEEMIGPAPSTPEAEKKETREGGPPDWQTQQGTPGA